jgi:hypothetical protein
LFFTVLVSAVVLFFEEKHTPPFDPHTLVPVPVPDTRHLYRYVTGIAIRTIRTDSCGSGGETFLERNNSANPGVMDVFFFTVTCVCYILHA